MTFVPRFPAYPKKQHASGQARLRFRGKDYYLGKFGTPDSRREYARLANEFALNPERALPKPLPEVALTVADLVVAFIDDSRKRKGAKHRETEHIMAATAPLLRLFGDILASDFDTGRIEALRDAMIDASWMTDAEREKRQRMNKPCCWSRNHVNHQLRRIKKIFRWGETKRLIPKGIYAHLKSAMPIERDSPARRNVAVKPVEESVVEATRPFMSAMTDSMIGVQMGTGMRPSELVRMRVDRIFILDNGVWHYRLDEFKTDHLEDAEDFQTVVLGPKAQADLAPWYHRAARLGPTTYIWRPNAKSPCHISEEGLYQAVTDAAKRAGVKHWFPYQIRHTVKRAVEHEFGEQAARAVLRHRTVQTTRKYANQQDVGTAEKVARKIG